MLYMVYEKFRTAGAKEVYRRSREKGRMLPEGLREEWGRCKHV